ncbi:hypothetical protein L2703_15255 [Shewanella basaltis]|uniref:hypothetical protein n=1 Tax=Shewanella basaltis TaxID=472183 RepID=UPI00200D1373|nr:hypothetical protein [Shewanella basaltis]MCL1114946.1 hypothetical protein [Shewanella basaltis]
MKNLIIVLFLGVFVLLSGCASKRPISLPSEARIGVYSSVTDKTNNNIWDETTARADQQKDIIIDVNWGLKGKVESSLVNEAGKKWSIDALVVTNIEASLGAGDAISYGFSSVYEKFIPALTEVKENYDLDVIIIAKPAWRHYHGETPLYNKGIGIQSFEDGLTGHVAVEIFAIDLHTMKIIFPAVQDGITMQPFIRNFDLPDSYADVDRASGKVLIKDAYKNKVFAEVDNIISWYINEVPISFSAKKI